MFCSACPAHPAVAPALLSTAREGSAGAAGVCKACFSNEHMAKHSRMGEYREQFVKDLDPSSPGWPATLGDLSGRLKTWRATLQSTVEDSMPPYLRLEDEARNLQVRAPFQPLPQSCGIYACCTEAIHICTHGMFPKSRCTVKLGASPGGTWVVLCKSVEVICTQHLSWRAVAPNKLNKH